MVEARPELTALGERVRGGGEHITVTRSGRPFFVMVPPAWYADALRALAQDTHTTHHQEKPMEDLSHLDERLRAAVAADDDQALTGLADEIEQAGLPLLAEDVRTRKSAGLRNLGGG